MKCSESGATKASALAAAIAALALSDTSGAAVLTWNGSASGDYNTAANWTLTSGTDADNLPDADDDVVFPAGAGNPAIGDANSTADTVNGITFTTPVSPASATAYSIGASGGTVAQQTLNTDLTGITLQTGAGNQTFTRPVALNGGTQVLSVADAGQTLTFGNTFAGTATVNKVGQGTVIFNGAVGGSSFNTTLDVDAGILEFRGTSASLSKINGDATGTITNTTGTTRTLTAISTGSYSGGITGNLNYEQGRSSQNDTGVQTFAGSNSYTGTTTISGGRITVNGTHTGAGNYLVRGKNGAANNNHTGVTGTLAGIGTVALAAGKTMLVQGFDLSTLGSYDGDSNTISVGIVSPGDAAVPANAVGTLTVGDVANTGANANVVTFGNFSRLEAELKSAGASDRLAVLGNLALTGASDELRLDLLNGETLSATYVLASYSGSLSGTFNSVFYEGVLDSDPTVEIANTNYRLDYGDGSNDAIRLVLVPEPASLALAALGGIGLGVRRRRGCGRSVASQSVAGR